MEINSKNHYKLKLKNGFVLIGSVSPRRQARRKRRNKNTTETQPETEKQTSPNQKNALSSKQTEEEADPLQYMTENWAQLAQRARQKQPNTKKRNSKKGKKNNRLKHSKTIQTPPALIRKIPPPSLTRKLPSRSPSKNGSRSGSGSGYKPRRIVHTYNESDVDMTQTRRKLTFPSSFPSFPSLQEANSKEVKSSLRKSGGYRATRVATAYDPNYNPTNDNKKYSNFADNRFENNNNNNFTRNYSNNFNRNDNFNRNQNNFNRNQNNFNRNDNFNRNNNNTTNVSSDNNENNINTRPSGLSSRCRGFRAKRVPSESVRPSYVSSNQRSNSGRTPPRQRTPPRPRVPINIPNTPPKRRNIPQKRIQTPPKRMQTPPKRTVTPTRPRPRPKPKQKQKPKKAQNTQVETQIETQQKHKSKHKHKHKRKSKQNKQSKTPRAPKKNVIAALDQNEKTKKYLLLRKQGSLSYNQDQNTFIIKKNDNLHLHMHEVASVKPKLAKQISSNEGAASNEYYYNKNDMLHYVSNKDFEALNDRSVVSGKKIKSSAESFNPIRNISIATTSIPNISRTTSAPTPPTNVHRRRVLPNIYSHTQDIHVFDAARRAASAAATQQALNSQFQFVTTAPITQQTPITPQGINNFVEPILYNTNIQNPMHLQSNDFNNYIDDDNFINVEDNNYDNYYDENNNVQQQQQDNYNGYNGRSFYKMVEKWGKNYYEWNGRSKKKWWNKYRSNRYKKNWWKWNDKKDNSEEEEEEEYEEEFLLQQRLDFRVLPKWCQHNNITTLYKCVDGETDIIGYEESQLLDGNLYFNFLCSAVSDPVYEYLGFKEIILSQIYFLNKSIRKRVHDTAPLLLQTYCFL